MAYSSSGKLGIEYASKLGHIDLINDPWINDLVKNFNSKEIVEHDISKWYEYDRLIHDEIQYIWAVDGSIAEVKSELNPKKEMAFVKAAMLQIDKKDLSKINSKYPQPERLKDVLSKSSFFVSTVFPLKYIRSNLGSNQDAMRYIAYNTLKQKDEGVYLETLKWLIYEKWTTKKSASSEFSCPDCGTEKIRFKFDTELDKCSICGTDLYLTDTLSFHTDMDIDQASIAMPSRYMTILEHLLLFSAIRLLLENKRYDLINKSIFIKDGPLMLPSQYSRLVPQIRSLIEFLKNKNIKLKLFGQEKSGALVEYLDDFSEYLRHRDFGKSYYRVLTHGEIHADVLSRKISNHVYGERTNWGEKVLFVIAHSRKYVLNIPTGVFKNDHNSPCKDEVLELESILSIICDLESVRHENALYPIELVNNIASLSNYPSAKILSKYISNSV